MYYNIYTLITVIYEGIAMKAVIIGGGASGIAAAIKIKQNNPNFDVTVLEHLDDILKKIHATGNGRCNIANKSAEHCGEVLTSFHRSVLYCVKMNAAECILIHCRRQRLSMCSKDNVNALA